jgi:hypothetical protein
MMSTWLSRLWSPKKQSDDKKPDVVAVSVAIKPKMDPTSDELNGLLRDVRLLPGDMKDVFSLHFNGQNRRLETLIEEVTGELNQSLFDSLKETTMATIDFIEDSLQVYTDEVMSQFLSIFRSGRRKKLKEIKALKEYLIQFRKEAQEASHFPLLQESIRGFQSQMQELDKKISGLKLKYGNLGNLLDGTVGRFISINKMQAFTPAFIANLFDHLTQINQEKLSCSKNSLASSIIPNQKIRDLEIGLQEIEKALSKGLNEQATVLIKEVTAQLRALQQEASSSEADSWKPISIHFEKLKASVLDGNRVFKSSREIANKNYNDRMQEILETYRARIHRQWFWWWRLGSLKLELLQQIINNERPMLSQEDPLNEKHFAQTLEKIRVIQEKIRHMKSRESRLDEIGSSIACELQPDTFKDFKASKLVEKVIAKSEQLSEKIEETIPKEYKRSESEDAFILMPLPGNPFRLSEEEKDEEKACPVEMIA